MCVLFGKIVSVIAVTDSQAAPIILVVPKTNRGPGLVSSHVDATVGFVATATGIRKHVARILTLTSGSHIRGIKRG